MKSFIKLYVCTTLVLNIFSPLALADTVTLTSPEALTLPTASTMMFRITLIDAEEKILNVSYRWKDAEGKPITTGRAPWQTWECSGECFTDVFGFVIRSQDVGAKIGVGLRTLIWNKMKGDVLTGTNDGAFGE